MRSARTLLLIVLSVALVTTVVGSATRGGTPPPRERDAPAADRTPVPTAERALEIGAARQQPVRARAGRPLRLTVTGASTADVVVLDDLGQTAQISPDLDAVFDLLPDRPGTYPIRLQSTDQEVGVLRIRDQ